MFDKIAIYDMRAKFEALDDADKFKAHRDLAEEYNELLSLFLDFRKAVNSTPTY